MAKASAVGVEESRRGSTPFHRDNEQKQFDRGAKSVGENPQDVIEYDMIDSGAAAAERHFAYQDGSCQSLGNEDKDDVAGNESESLSDIDDFEVNIYFHNEKEKHYKTIIWERMNREYIEEQAVKKAAASEGLLNARQLAAATAAAVAKSRKGKKQKRAANSKNRTLSQTASVATREVLTKKRLSSKVNFEVLDALFGDSIAPEDSKKKRVESDPDNETHGLQISEESGEKEVSDVVDNNDDFRDYVHEEADGGSAYGDGLYYGNEEDGYGYGDNDDY